MAREAPAVGRVEQVSDETYSFGDGVLDRRSSPGSSDHGTFVCASERAAFNPRRCRRPPELTKPVRRLMYAFTEHRMDAAGTERGEHGSRKFFAATDAVSA